MTGKTVLPKTKKTLNEYCINTVGKCLNNLDYKETKVK